MAEFRVERRSGRLGLVSCNIVSQGSCMLHVSPSLIFQALALHDIAGFRLQLVDFGAPVQNERA